MPKYQFLKEGKKLNKDIFTSAIFELYNESQKYEDNDSELDKTINNLERERALTTLRFFVVNTTKYLNHDLTIDFIKEINYEYRVRERAFAEWKRILIEHTFPSPELNKLINLFKHNEQNKNYSLPEMAEMVKKLIDPKYYNEVKSDELDFIKTTDILDHLDKYADFLSMKLGDEKLEEIGYLVNDFYNKFDFEHAKTNENPIYDKEINEIINDLNLNKTLDNKVLTPEEIKGYEYSLNYANYLFTKPNVDFGALTKEKVAIQNALLNDANKNIDERITNLGFDPDAIRNVLYKEGNGFYLAMGHQKEDAYKKNVSECEMKFSDKTKEGLKLIFTKLHEYGFDKLNLNDNESSRDIGLGYITDVAKKYKEAINSSDIETRKKAAIYAKELADIDVKTKEILSLIEKYLPVNDKNNLAFPESTDVIKNENIPTSLRIDYVKASQLAGLNNILSLIEKKKWDIDDFLESPLKFIKEAYKDDYLDKINTVNFTKDLHGTDLMFSLATKAQDDFATYLSFDGIRILDSLASLENDKDTRSYNKVMYEIFNRNIDQPYYSVYQDRKIIANNQSLDRIIINPNLKFTDLGIKYYDIETLNIKNEEGTGFDEIEYIKEKNESFKDFKERLDSSILEFMQKELDLVKKNQNPNCLFFKTNDYLDIAQKAALKMLIVRRSEHNDPHYQELEHFIKNKGAYVNNLFSSNNTIDPKYYELREAYNKGTIINNKPYPINNISTTNKYKNMLNEYENYINNTKTGFNRKEAVTISEELNQNNLLKAAYNKYAQANTKYQNEVKKLYGNNYNGIPDNTRNEKISTAFIKRNEAYRKLNNLKADYIKLLESRTKYARIPYTYYIDRMNQLEKDDYKELPPYFRSDQMISRDDYIKSRYSDAILTEEQKDYLFNEYKNLMNEKENDFYSKKFLEVNKLAVKTKTEVKLIKDNIKYTKINNNLEEAKFLGIDNNTINNLHIGDNNHPFDELSYINKNSVTPANFKANLDKLLLNYLISYKSIENNHSELQNKPKLADIISVAQKATLKYLLVSNYDNTNDLNKELKHFVIDGNSYLDKLINDEKQKINANNSEFNEVNKNIILSINYKDYKISDFDINQYSNKFNEFDEYYKLNKDNNILDNIRTYELYINDLIKRKLEELEILESKDTNDLDNEVKNIVNNIQIKEKDLKEIEEKHSKEYEIAKLKVDILKLKDELKTELNEYYKNGQITDYYMNERFRRLDNNDLTFPAFYKITDIKSMNDYIIQKYPNNFNELTKDQKTDIYNNYKNGLEFERRKYLLTNFLITKELTEEKEFISKDYNDYLANRPSDLFELNREGLLLNDENLHMDDEVYLRNKENEFIKKVNNYGKNKDIKIDDNIIINKDDTILNFNEDEKIITNDEELDEENEISEKVLYWLNNQNPVDIVNNEEKETAESVWVKSFISVMKDRLGSDSYDGEKLDDLFKYDKHELFDYWIDSNSKKLREMFGKDLPNMFKESVNRLSPDWKQAFEKSYYKFNNSIENGNNYYTSLFGKYEFKYKDEEKDIKIDTIYTEEKDIGFVPKKYANFTKQIQHDLSDKKEDLIFDEIEEDEIDTIIDKNSPSLK